MRRRTLDWLRVTVATVLCVALAGTLAGCCPFIPTKSTNGTGKPTPKQEASPTPSADDSPTPGSMDESETAIVPNVVGLYYEDAAGTLEAAGFQPVDISIHGPIDEDAGEIGKIYRQTPTAGQQLPLGTKIELRSWWESQ